MKQILSLFIVSLVSLAAQAKSSVGDFKCIFTEPFLTLETNIEKKLITVTGHQEGFDLESHDKTLDHDLAKKLYKIGHTEVFYEGEKDKAAVLLAFARSVLRIRLYTPASDGMSDTEYVHEGILRTPNTTIYGGCDSL